MATKSDETKKGGRKKLDNIISKLAKHQLNKTNENVDVANLPDEVPETTDALLKTESLTGESNRKSKRKPEKTSKAAHNQQNDDQAENNLTIVKPVDSDDDILEQEEANSDAVVEEGKRESKKKKRKKSEKDLQEDTGLPRFVNCSACNKSIATKKTGKLCRHPDLNTLICKKCYKFYSSGKFSKDEYGVEEYCRWCADGGDLICCDFCEKAFCKECVKRNLGKSKLKELLEAGEDEQWNCFCCDPEPISSKILLCNRVMRLFDDKKDQHTPYRDKKGREIIHGPNQSERRSLLTNIAGEELVKNEELPHTSYSRKTYSKRFQNGVDTKSKGDKKSGNSSGEEKLSIKKESDEENHDVTAVISSEEDVNEKREENKASQSTKRKEKGEKSKSAKKKSGKRKKKSDKHEDTVDNSSEELAHSRKKSRGKVCKKSSRKKVLESDSGDDFVSMVKDIAKKSKHVNGKKSKNNKRRALSSKEASEKEPSEEDSGDAEDKGKGKVKRSKKKVLKAQTNSDDEDGSTSKSDEEPSPVKKKGRRNRKAEKKKSIGNRRWRLRNKRGESDESDSDTASDEDTPKKRKGRKRKGSGKKKKAMKKRKRGDDDDDDDDEEEEEDSDDDENASPSKKGRKKIRKILANDKLEEATKHARKLEEERRKRLVERTKNTTFEKPASVDVKEVVLEYKSDGETPLVWVDEDLVKHLKPHQVEGVKFIYDCTIESAKSWEKKEEGSGCILAHVMGLGKTLQVITLVHTLCRSDLIKLTRVLVVGPLNTVLNWQVEFEKWISVDDRLDVYVLNEAGPNNWNRADMLKRWHNYGGVLIMGYTMYRNLSQCVRVKNKHQRKIFTESLVNPGPELVVCDEGHILRNCKSAISIAMNGIKTKRRIVLTGTPLQNNLFEYHCMVSFVKPSLLGTLKEFSNSFIQPIQNGQCADSTPIDVRLMKNRCHVLHKLLAGCVQRKDYADIAPFLPPKFEYVIKVRLSAKQREMYKYYLETFLTSEEGGVVQAKSGSLFSDYQALMRIWTHPWCLRLESARQIEKFIDTDDSMADFVVESGEEEDSPLSSEEMSWTSDSSKSDTGKRDRQRGANTSGSSSSPEEKSDEEQSDSDDLEIVNTSDVKHEKQTSTEENSKKINVDPGQPSTSSAVIDLDDDVAEVKPDIGDKAARKPPQEKGDGSAGFSTLRSGQEFKEGIIQEAEWYDKFLTEEDETNVELGSKIVLLLEILADASALDEKVLVFSHSLISLDLIEKALGGGQIGGNAEDWCRGCDYFRMDGSTSAQMRKRWADIFNDEENKAARLFLISTKAGGLGINLIGASRVIVFDISWNPSHDVQSIFRAYRFGQNKPVFVYRFIAEGTMEEKIYDRQVTKLSVSQRVVDEHQIQRHFNANDLSELYRFEPDVLENENDERPIPAIPKDPILAELINRLYPKWIVKYHEHDSLLRNRPEEELSEAERKEAWENYEAEKQGINNRMPFMQNDVGVNPFNIDTINQNGVPVTLPNSDTATGINFGVLAQAQQQRAASIQQLQLHRQQQQQQQQRVLEEQRRRLFEYERQRSEMERQRAEELRKRQAAIHQLEIRRQEEARARQVGEREMEERRRQQMEHQQSQQFLQQLLRNRGNQSAYVTQQTGLPGYPAGQSMFRVVVNPNPRPQSRRSPPRITELPPDA